MSHRSISRSAFACLLVGLVLGFAGCFASKFTLIELDKAKVDRAYLGDWDAANVKGDHVALTIRNIDDKLYYVETREKHAASKVDRYVGFIADVKGVRFAHVRPITEDGNVPDQWIIMRIELADQKLTIKQLGEDFMKDKTIESAEQLRQVLEDNVNNEAMYPKDELITATRVGK